MKTGRSVAFAGVALLACGCGMETRGWVLSEREVQVSDADAACSGCSYRLVLDELNATTERGGTDGNGYVDVCPADGVLIGYEGALQKVPVTVNGVGSTITVVGSLRATCGSVSVSASKELTIVPIADPLPVRGDPANPVTWSQSCPPGEVIVGVEGSAGIFLDRVSFVCAQLAVTVSASGPSLTTSAGRIFPAVGGDGGVAFQDRCPMGQIARGQALRSGVWINAFALLCATPSLTIAPPGDGGLSETGT